MALRIASALAALAIVVTTPGCGGRVGSIQTAVTSPAPSADTLAQLWVDPGDAPRDLFWGVGGQSLAPSMSTPFDVEARDEAGFSVSYDVKGADGVRWSAKIGPEAQSEVVVSRILWGLGYHQPPTYYLPSWTARGPRETRRESEARFRPKLPTLEAGESWQWADNPFLPAREFRGMLVVLLMLNSTDLKDSNNTVYDVKDAKGATGPVRWFLVRDLGAALGETGKLFPRRNWLEGFERSGFITGVAGNRVEFDYRGRHQELLTMIRPGDVTWAAQRLQRFTDQQWRDAFRAGNYDAAIANRFVARIKAKIADGLALQAAPGTAS
jgi:hypothetical protein